MATWGGGERLTGHQSARYVGIPHTVSYLAAKRKVNNAVYKAKKRIDEHRIRSRSDDKLYLQVCKKDER